MENKPRGRGRSADPRHDAERAVEDGSANDAPSLVEQELGAEPEETSGDGGRQPMFDGVEESEADRFETEKALGGDALEDPHTPGTPGPLPARAAPADPNAKSVYNDEDGEAL